MYNSYTILLIFFFSLLDILQLKETSYSFTNDSVVCFSSSEELYTVSDVGLSIGSNSDSFISISDVEVSIGSISGSSVIISAYVL